MSKEIILKLIEGRIDTITQLTTECIEMVFNAGINEGLEKATLAIHDHDYGADGEEIRAKIRKLKV